ncbi:hypothetical protein Vsou_00200 [Vulcanisaeta souniana JCM 11219]|uniref:Uncharacterized protein n=1 Tax=Vulcanisaeta souniana JCM 11219 TaxID=1293586 RepID=A0ABN6SQ26_9CREN|nr:hypothetical protein Vsou_00200 [Vulcanisaeta souniana JCM 11219]
MVPKYFWVIYKAVMVFNPSTHKRESDGKDQFAQ